MSNAPGTNGQLGIIELGEVCAAMRAHNLELFEQLGGWVADTPDPNLQRLYAEACHRHAWHAQLWAERMPTIPPVEFAAELDVPKPQYVAPHLRASVYGAGLDQLSTRLDALAVRVDPLLDPATTRTIELVLADGAALRQRLALLSAGV